MNTVTAFNSGASTSTLLQHHRTGASKVKQYRVMVAAQFRMALMGHSQFSTNWLGNEILINGMDLAFPSSPAIAICQHTPGVARLAVHYHRRIPISTSDISNENIENSKPNTEIIF